MPPCQGKGSSHDSTGIGTGKRPSTTAPLSSSRYSRCLCCIFPPLLAQAPPHLKPKASGLSPTTKTCLKGSANGTKHES